MQYSLVTQRKYMLTALFHNSHAPGSSATPLAALTGNLQCGLHECQILPGPCMASSGVEQRLRMLLGSSTACKPSWVLPTPLPSCMHSIHHLGVRPLYHHGTAHISTALTSDKCRVSSAE